MNCVDVGINLSAFIDGETEFTIHREIEFHLESCCECAAEAEGMRLISRNVKNLPIVGAPNSIDAVVLTALHSRNSKTDPAPPVNIWYPIPRIAWVSFALVTIVIATSAFFVGVNVVPATQAPGIAISVPLTSPPTPIQPKVQTVTEYINRPCGERVRKSGGLTATNKRRQQGAPEILFTNADLSGMKPLAKLEVAVVKE